MLEIVLTRDDANSDSALLAEWLVDDREPVRKGRPVCVVETSKASVEIEAPGDGVVVQLVAPRAPSRRPASSPPRTSRP
jgi:glycine cleavage system H lipoate-binding protein